MATKIKRKERLAARATLLFDWRTPASPLVPKLAALTIAGAVFTLLLVSLRVRVITPGIITGHRASLMLMPTNANAGEWLSKAREGGPFPSRFEPQDWPYALTLEREAIDMLRQPPAPYIPTLRELPVVEAISDVPLASKGERVFPPVPQFQRAVGTPSALRVMPGLYPLSGITADEIPEKMPPFPGDVTAAMASAPWRFLIRLQPGGGVAACTSLAGSEEPGTEEITAWLRQITFDPTTCQRSPWIAVAVYFTNQPADGTDTR